MDIFKATDINIEHIAVSPLPLIADTVAGSKQIAEEQDYPFFSGKCKYINKYKRAWRPWLGLSRLPNFLETTPLWLM